MQSQQPDDAMPAAMPGSESASELHGARARAKARQCAEGQTIHRAECPDSISKIDSDTYNPLLSWKFIWILLQNAILFMNRVRRGTNIMPKLFWMD